MFSFGTSFGKLLMSISIVTTRSGPLVQKNAKVMLHGLATLNPKPPTRTIEASIITKIIPLGSLL